MKKTTWLITAGIAAVIVLGYFLFQGTGNRMAEAEAAAAALERKQKAAEETLARAERLFQGYYYDEALTALRENPELFSEPENGLPVPGGANSGGTNPSADGGADPNADGGTDPSADGGGGTGLETVDPIAEKIREIEGAKASLVKYEGPIQHIFFHSLIVYPELAFDDKGHPAQGYNMWMTTVSEFKAMLPLLREKGYVLYDLNEYIQEDPENPEKTVQKDIYLPAGKIPLALSIDDVNYYDYMKPDGFANRLVMGDDGRVWTEVITPEGETTVTRDGDVMPILDDFVEKYPDFSYRGAKGTIALTGYQGALGYRITDDLPEEAEWQQTVKTIADALRADGWNFACHSYTHNNSWFQGGRATLAQVKYDTDRWKLKIEPWVGETDIYISPFGFQWKNNDARYRYIIEQGGYRMFCPVGNSRTIRNNGDHIVMPRVNLDGYTMYKRAEEVKKYYFDVENVLDAARPSLGI